MIDIKQIRESPDLVKENIKKKFQNEKLPLVDKIKSLDEKWRFLKSQIDKLRQERNEVSKQVSEAKKQNKPTSPLLKKAKQIPQKIQDSESKANKIEEEIKSLMMQIPNIIHKSVPIGKDDTENKEIKKFGKPKVPNFEVLNHVQLAENLGGLDLDSARRTSGQGFYFLKGDIALLSTAMTSFARDYMVKQGFTYVEPPLMIRSKIVDGVMSFEEKDIMMYKIDDEDLYLIGTSEHAMIGMLTGSLTNLKDLPLKYTSFSACFRKEKGAHGIEEKGLYRVHQFNKQEMIVVCHPKESYEWYEKMLQHTVNVFKQLNIPVRTLEICSGDLADLKAKSADVEAWSPRQKKYFEVGSCSNLTDAQARRLNIKFLDKDNQKKLAHTLNNTVLATPRALIALMENNQQKDGSIKIPDVLQKYMNGKKFIGKTK